MKKILSFGTMLALALFVAGHVSAHITVQPKEVVAGSTVSLIRVPNEKDIATTRVRVVIPEGVDVHGIMPLAGWQYAMTHEEVKNSMDGSTEHADGHGGQGRVTEIVWSGGKIGVGEFMEFPLSVQYKGDMDKVTWKAYQTYADGEVVPWDGTDEGHPAPAVTVLKEAKMDAIAKAVGMTSGVTTSAQSSWMSVGALLLSAVALAVSLKKK